MKGSGSIYQRGNAWWVSYTINGRRVREPGGATPTAARNRLKEVRGSMDAGTYQPAAARKVTVSELLDDLQQQLEARGRKSATKARSHMKHLREAFGQLRACDLTTAMVERYHTTRMKDDGRAAATVSRECELLRQAFRRAYRVRPRRVAEIPDIPLPTVSNARQGFMAPADFNAAAAALTDVDVRDFVEWFWWTGMRPNEIRQLTWAMFDRSDWTLVLDPNAAKIGKGRVIAVVGPLRAIVERRLARRRFGCELVFHRTSKGRDGQPVKDFTKQWRAALAAAGLDATLIPYDLRRSALRNMVRGGTDYTVAMKISGHRTRSTFDRYNIVSTEDISAAIARTADYVGAQPETRSVTDRSQSTGRARRRSK